MCQAGLPRFVELPHLILRAVSLQDVQERGRMHSPSLWRPSNMSALMQSTEVPHAQRLGGFDPLSNSSPTSVSQGSSQGSQSGSLTLVDPCGAPSWRGLALG